jgi:hypothetical protein
MTSDNGKSDQIPNGAGEGDTDTDAPDTSSGGEPQQPASPPHTEESDGTPTENPSGG